MFVEWIAFQVAVPVQETIRDVNNSPAQWIAMGITAILALTSIIIGVYQSGQSQKAASASEKARADMATMKLDILEKLSEKLSDFVQEKHLKDYIESHAKEHLNIQQELTRFRDWREAQDLPMSEVKRFLKTLKDHGN